MSAPYFNLDQTKYLYVNVKGSFLMFANKDLSYKLLIVKYVNLLASSFEHSQSVEMFWDNEGFQMTQNILGDGQPFFKCPKIVF